MSVDWFLSRYDDSPWGPATKLDMDDIEALNHADIDLYGWILNQETRMVSFGDRTAPAVIEKVTGGVLGNWTPPEHLAHMVEALEAYEAWWVIRKRNSQLEFGSARQTTEEEIEESNVRELQKLFRLCAARGLGLVADCYAGKDL